MSQPQRSQKVRRSAGRGECWGLGQAAQVSAGRCSEEEVVQVPRVAITKIGEIRLPEHSMKNLVEARAAPLCPRWQASAEAWGAVCRILATSLHPRHLSPNNRVVPLSMEMACLILLLQPKREMRHPPPRPRISMRPMDPLPKGSTHRNGQESRRALPPVVPLLQATSHRLGYETRRSDASLPTALRHQRRNSIQYALVSSLQNPATRRCLRPWPHLPLL